jgi:DNA invertase Pin-like site-specific DNA recombinase
LGVIIAWVRARRIPARRAGARVTGSPPRDTRPPATGPRPRASLHAIPATPKARSLAAVATESPEPAPALNAPDRRVAGYLTVERGAEGRRRLDRARRELEALCQRRGLELVSVEHDVEPRDDRLASRPGLAEVARRIAAGELSGIVAPRLRDLAGSSVTLAGLLGWLRDAHACVIAVDYRLDTTTPAGAHAAHVLIELGEWERTGFAQPTKPALAVVSSQPVPGQLAAVRDHSELSARVMAMRAEGMSLQAIADQLNQEGVPTLRGGAEWRASSLQAATGYKRPSRRSGIEINRPRPTATTQHRRADDTSADERPRRQASG